MADKIQINMIKREGVVLKTADTYVDKDIEVMLDSSLIPTGELSITENGTYDVTNQASAVVNVESGLTVNGIVEEYKVKAEETISAGDFVEFINTVSWGSGELGNSFASACKVNNNTMLIIHKDSQTSNYVATVWTMDGTTVIAGTGIVLDGIPSTTALNVTVLNNNVLIAYCDVNNSDYGTACVLTIDGATITVGTKTVFNSATTKVHCVDKLSENKVLCVYRSGDSSTNLLAMVLNIDGINITTGEATVVINEGYYSMGYVKAKAINDNTAVIVYHGYLTSYNITAAILSINDDLVTVGTPVTYANQIKDGLQSLGISIAIPSENKVLIAYSDQRTGTSARGWGAAILLSIDGTNLIIETTKILYKDDHNSSIISAVALAENRVLVTSIYKSGSNQAIATVLDINNNQMTTGTEKVFVNSNVNTLYCAPMSATTALVLYDANFTTLEIDGARITENTTVENGTLIRLITQQADGIAKTDGNAGEIIEVYTPKILYSVTLIASSNTADAQYSIDNGQTWITIALSEETFIKRAETIRFKCASSNSYYYTCVGTKSYYQDVAYLSAGSQSDDIPITQDTTYYISYEYYNPNSGGGGGTN